MCRLCFVAVHQGYGSSYTFFVWLQLAASLWVALFCCVHLEFALESFLRCYCTFQGTMLVMPRFDMSAVSRIEEQQAFL